MGNGTRIKHQTSETFLVSAILSFSGGLQDAYTYYSRDKVFANAQTGNVVIMSKMIMTGNFTEALQYLAPVLAFALGVLIAEHIGHIAHSKYKSNNIKIHWRQVVVFLEVIILFAVGFIPVHYNMLASSLVSLSCAMQVEAFKTVHGFGYASTMCIGNLRCAMESLSMSVRDKDKDAKVKMLYYYGIIFTFAIGSGVGGILSDIMEMKAIWVCCLLLLICCFLMIKKHSIFGKSKNSKYLYTLTRKNNRNKKNKDKNNKSSTKMITEISSSQNVYVDIDIEAGMSTAPSNSIRNMVVDEYNEQNDFIPLEEDTVDNSSSNDEYSRTNHKQNNIMIIEDTGQKDITKLEEEIIVIDNYNSNDTDIITEVDQRNFLRLEDIHHDLNFDIEVDKEDRDGASTTLSLSTAQQTIINGDNASQTDNSFRIVTPYQKEVSRLEPILKIDPALHKDHLNKDTIILDNISPKDTIKVEDLLINNNDTHIIKTTDQIKKESLTVDDTLRNDSI
ncbi:hypothetical protein PIROE2DRAFT_63331 [Piromyces sp. E2]|nr:hypothetical protein PIROE2DRAFT_63331 [Piromyces sp. E2]|eukprot:OUM60165.1 hypothetical protein PIROE2DRAFT_63331 [Piromyces sp. E2]